MARRIGSLVIKLGLDSATFKSGLKDARGDMSRTAQALQKSGAAIGAAFAGAMAGAVGGFALLAKQSIDVADEMSKVSQAIGVGVEELSRLRYAADLSGVGFDALQTAIGRLNKNMFEAASGAGGAGRAFSALGVSVKGSDGSLRSTTDVMGDVADRFATMQDGAAKTALAMQVFGRAGADLIPMLNGGRDGLRELTEEADRFGIVIDAETGRKAEQFNDNLTRLQGAFSATAAKIAAELLPHLVRFTDWLIENRADINRAISKFGQFINGAIILGERVGAAADWIEQRFGGVFRAINLLINPLSRVIKLVTGIGGQGARIPDVGLRDPGAAMLDIIAAEGKLRPAFAAGERAAFDFGEAMSRGVGGGAGRASAGLRRLTSDAETMANRLQSVLDRAFPDLARLRELNADRQLLEDAMRRGQISPETEADARFNLGPAANLGPATVSAWLTEGGAVTDVIQRVTDHARDMGEELARALAPIPDRFAELKLAGGQAFASLGDQLSGVLQGAQSLGDALRNLVSQLADMAFQMAFRALGTSIGIPGFATGTLSAPRGLALVGENGPELVNFGGGERVFNNNDTRRMMAGSGGGQFTIHLHGVQDARGGREAAAQIAHRLRRQMNGV